MGEILYPGKKRIREFHRLKAIAYLGGKCVDCDWSGNPDGFEFDHVEGTNLSRAGHRYSGSGVGIRLAFRWETLLKELKLCELVCGTCHNIRTAKRRRDAQELVAAAAG